MQTQTNDVAGNPFNAAGMNPGMFQQAVSAGWVKKNKSGNWILTDEGAEAVSSWNALSDEIRIPSVRVEHTFGLTGRTVMMNLAVVAAGVLVVGAICVALYYAVNALLA